MHGVSAHLMASIHSVHRVKDVGMYRQGDYKRGKTIVNGMQKL